MMEIQVKVKPSSRREELSQDGDGFIARVKEPPKEGKANMAVIKLLAEHFGVSQSQVKIIGGLRSRSKLIKIEQI
jgi:hypothetical protein